MLVSNTKKRIGEMVLDCQQSSILRREAETVKHPHIYYLTILKLGPSEFVQGILEIYWTWQQI